MFGKQNVVEKQGYQKCHFTNTYKKRRRKIIKKHLRIKIGNPCRYIFPVKIKSNKYSNVWHHWVKYYLQYKKKTILRKDAPVAVRTRTLCSVSHKNVPHDDPYFQQNFLYVPWIMAALTYSFDKRSCLANSLFNLRKDHITGFCWVKLAVLSIQFRVEILGEGGRINPYLRQIC